MALSVYMQLDRDDKNLCTFVIRDVPAGDGANAVFTPEFLELLDRALPNGSPFEGGFAFSPEVLAAAAEGLLSEIQ